MARSDKGQPKPGSGKDNSTSGNPKKRTTARELIHMGPDDGPAVGTQRWADAQKAKKENEK